jgi:hypothetical protein
MHNLLRVQIMKEYLAQKCLFELCEVISEFFSDLI